MQLAKISVGAGLVKSVVENPTRPDFTTVENVIQTRHRVVGNIFISKISENTP